MKKLLLALTFIFSFYLGYSNPIEESKARIIATNFLKFKAAGVNRYLNQTLELKNNPSEDGYFLFIVQNDVGFILIASDDASIPVLGYSLDEKFDIANQPIQLKKWLDNYSDQIEFIQRNGINATVEIKNLWSSLLTPPASNIKQTGTQAVSPLISVSWDQAPYYNALCPYDNGYAERTVTGCVATAMAQIMKYHSYPTKGSGFHSFKHSKYGTLSANFGATTYNWSGMPSSVNSANSDVATLMYHCGVSVDMNYGVADEGGSGAYPSAIDDAFETYFGYSTSAQEVFRSSYSDANWIAMLKSEFDAGRPVEYHGFGNGGGHSFICDGYDNSNMFHYNWGWSGVANGYYSVNALNPTAIGYGGGLGSYNSNQGAIIGIKPPTVAPGNFTLELNSTPAFVSSTVTYGAGVTLNATIKNSGTVSFTGELAAALFNSNGVFVQYIETKTAVTLSASASTAYSFVNAALGSSATPGNYSAYLYYKVSGGSWTAINGGSFNNIASLTIQSQNSGSTGLTMATALIPSATSIVRNAPFSVDVDITNNDASSFSGDLSVDIYDLDYNSVGVVEELNGVNIAASATSGFTFSSTGMDLPGGTYLMVLWYYDGSSWEVVGEGAFYNPDYIIFSEPAPNADVYESNNSSINAYDLTGVVSNGVTFDTDGSNLHIGSDLDYYYVTLPNADYSIDARVHDSYDSGNGFTYTADVMFSYNTGSGYGNSYDDIMPNYIHVYGGGDVEFLVAPYFTGEVGTYLLDMTIYEGIVDAFQDPTLQSRKILVYPNPSKGNLNFEIPNSTSYAGLIVYNAQGNNVFATDQASGSVSLEFLPNGMYTIELLKENGVSDHAKFTIQK